MNGNGRYRGDAFGLADFLWRWLASLVLVVATYNPSGFSYVHWVRGALAGEGIGAVHVLFGVLGLCGWAVLLVATNRSLGTLGAVLAAGLVAALIWLLVDLGLVGAGSMTAILWLALIALATLLAIGISWSHIWRRLTGQLEVDDD